MATSPRAALSGLSVILFVTIVHRSWFSFLGFLLYFQFYILSDFHPCGKISIASHNGANNLSIPIVGSMTYGIYFVCF